MAASKTLTPQQRKLRSSIGGFTSWANTEDVAGRTGLRRAHLAAGAVRTTDRSAASISTSAAEMAATLAICAGSVLTLLLSERIESTASTTAASIDEAPWG